MFQPKSQYHTASILAAIFDTYTLRHRLKTNRYHLSDLTADLTPSGRKLVAASACFPFSFNDGDYLIDCLDKWEGPLTKSVTPNCRIGNERTMQSYVVRGIEEKRLKKDQKQMEAFKCRTVEEMLAYYVACTSHGCATHVTSVEERLNVQKPFPQYFDSSLGIDGDVRSTQRPNEYDVYTVPILTGLHCDGNVCQTIDSLHGAVKKIKFKKFHGYRDAGLEEDDFRECLDRLSDFKECYMDDFN